jgi:hypothetical protein
MKTTTPNNEVLLRRIFGEGLPPDPESVARIRAAVQTQNERYARILRIPVEEVERRRAEPQGGLRLAEQVATKQLVRTRLK